MLTQEQLAILSAMADTNDNLVIDAKAGSGKTPPSSNWTSCAEMCCSWPSIEHRR
jgi:hypothetical protein